MVKSIGPVCAKKRVAKFGEGVFDIIEKESGRLEDVGRIGPNRQKSPLARLDPWASVPVR
jgi:hypothetical protein